METLIFPFTILFFVKLFSKISIVKKRKESCYRQQDVTKMKTSILKKIKMAMTMMAMACMLLTVVDVSSDTNLNVMLCGEKIEFEYPELE